MQYRSKRGQWTLKLTKQESDWLENARNLCAQLGKIADVENANEAANAIAKLQMEVNCGTSPKDGKP